MRWFCRQTLGLLALLFLVLPAAADTAFVTLPPPGKQANSPIRVNLGQDLSCQAWMRNDPRPAVWPPLSLGDCGLLVAVSVPNGPIGGYLYGPDFKGHDGSSYGGNPPTRAAATVTQVFHPIYQSPAQESGAAPFRTWTVTTSVDLPGADVMAREVTTYHEGAPTWNTQLVLETQQPWAGAMSSVWPWKQVIDCNEASGVLGRFGTWANNETVACAPGPNRWDHSLILEPLGPPRAAWVGHEDSGPIVLGNGLGSGCQCTLAIDNAIQIGSDSGAPNHLAYFAGEWNTVLFPAPLPFADAAEMSITPDCGSDLHFLEDSALPWTPTSWRWDFGDGAQATGKQVDHHFAAPGQYGVTLVVSNATVELGVSRTATVTSQPCCQDIRVPPPAAFRLGDVIRIPFTVIGPADAGLTATATGSPDLRVDLPGRFVEWTADRVGWTVIDLTIQGDGCKVHVAFATFIDAPQDRRDAMPDQDRDGVADPADNCPTVPNHDARDDQADHDADGQGDACDPTPCGGNPAQGYDPHTCAVKPGTSVPTAGPAPDRDHDGIADAIDSCPSIANPDQADLDHDGLGDVCDLDLDGDGVQDKSPDDPRAYLDDCPTVADPAQLDSDHDGRGDACQTTDLAATPSPRREAPRLPAKAVPGAGLLVLGALAGVAVARRRN